MKSLNHVPLSLVTLMMAGSLQAIEIEQRPLTTEPSKPVAAIAPVQVAAQATSARVAPAPATAPSNPAWDLFQQLESLRNTVAQLQGQVEEQQQLIDRLREDLKVRYTDLDQRLDAMTQAPAAPAAPTGSPAATPAAAVPAGVGASTVIPATAAAQAPVVSPAATPAPAAPAAVASAPVVPVTAPPAAPAKPKELTAEEIERQKQAYLAAYQRFRGEGPAAAVKAMQDFLKQNPDSVFAPNAYYWTGEFQLALDTPDYNSAETNFKKVISDYDGTPKVAAAYYKLGTIADLRGQRPEARRRMTDLVAKFPGSPEARLAQSWLDQNAGKP